MALILVVDDEQVVRDFITHVLEPDHMVVEVDDAERALAIVRKVRPALIVMDVNLQGTITSLEAVTQIASTPVLRGIPILAISGHTDTAMVSKLQQAGVKQYLEKPFHPSQLQIIVSNLLTVQVSTVAQHLMSLGEGDLVEAVSIALRNGSTLKITRALRQAILDIEKELAGEE